MPLSSAARISAPSASGVIMVPVGLAGDAISMPSSGVLACASRKVSGVTAQRVDAFVSISTGSQPSAVRMWR